MPEKEETAKTTSSTVQPDITVVCDGEKIKGHGCKGAPDLVIEILSPTSGKQDTIRKYKLYEKSAVKEYWIVDPIHQIIDRFHLDENLGKYKQAEYFHRDDTINPVIFPDLKIKLENIFPPIKLIEDEEDIEV